MVNQLKQQHGLLYAIAAYTFWGLVPIFWKQLDHIESFEIIGHRMVWSCFIVISLIIIFGQWKAFIGIFSQPKVLLRSFFAACFIISNWFIFIWAVTNEHMVQISMGYFINPLISVMLGIIIFKDKLRRGQLMPLAIMLIAVFYLVISQGKLPWIALFLAFTFAFYSALKKTVQLPAIQGMAIETGAFFIPALIYLLFLNSNGTGSFGVAPNISILLSLAGVFTITPLLLFAAAAKRSSMTVLGMTQYIGPSLQLLIGVFIYKESFGQTQLIAFGLIWFALILYSIDQIKYQKNKAALS